MAKHKGGKNGRALATHAHNGKPAAKVVGAPKPGNVKENCSR